MLTALPTPPPSFALIVAGGRGARAGEGVPKQFRMLAGMPVLRRSVLAFQEHPRVDRVQVVIHPDDAEAYQAAVDGLDLLPPVDGGPTRQASVLNGLRALAELGGPTGSTVLIHDAARPLLSRAMLDRCVAAIQSPAIAACVPALPIVDSLRRGGATLREQVDRAELLRVQTPQCFGLAAVLAAHEDAAASGCDFTDDAALMMVNGVPVHIVAGEEENLKLTTEADFERAETMLAARRTTRTGMGFDVHGFEAGDHVWIGGIRIAHSRSLKGHSDADVALHALTDALLGAAAAGDIGDHFPPTDPQWRGAPSALFLEHAREIVTQRGGRVEHADVTIICEAPRIGPHRAAMRERIAELLRLPLDRISVKATTTERLGFTGRGEGIAAQAVATISIADKP